MMQVLQAMSPEILLIALASVMYLAGTFRQGTARGWCLVSAAGIVLAGITYFGCASQATLDETSVVAADPLARFGSLLALVTGLALLMMSTRLSERETTAEYFASLLLIVAGGMFVAAARELVLLFLGLELISIPTYVVLSLARRDAGGQESALKYFFLSVFASALFLYGLSFVYGAVGTTHYSGLAQFDPARASAGTVGVAIVLIAAGIGFKIAAVPFHFYAPDVYQGTTNGAAAVLAWAPKAAGVLALLRLLVFTLPTAGTNTVWLLWILAAATMTLGNVMGLLQNHLRRLLAYSSIAQAGYMLVGLGAACAGGGEFLATAAQSVVFYLVAYAAMTLGAFAVLVYLDNPARRVETIDDLAGLARSHPLVAAAMATMLIGLTGIPLTAGFWGKLAIFGGAVTCRDPRYLWLAVIGVLNAAISSFYYLRIVGAMYMRDGDRRLQPVQPAGGRGPLAVLATGALATILIGVWPGPLLQAVHRIRPEEIQGTVDQHDAQPVAAPITIRQDKSRGDQNVGLNNKSVGDTLPSVGQVTRGRT